MLAIEELRQQYQRQICEQVICVTSSHNSNLSDASSRLSVDLAKRLLTRLGFPCSQTTIDYDTTNQKLKHLTKGFLNNALVFLQRLNPCRWSLFIHESIADFEQYKHLAKLAELVEIHKELKTTLGEYVIQPDIVVARQPLSDQEINQAQTIISQTGLPKFTPLRAQNGAGPTLHASISCKWTIRSDRSQNARTEGLNLIRNRKGHTPHIAVITGEPMPTRISSLALGTGDIDCVYHFALPELIEAVKELDNEAAMETLDMLVSGRRLRDISDLPFDLAI